MSPHLPHSELAAAHSPERTHMMKLAMFNEGVDMKGGIGFQVSAVHEEEQIDRTAKAFERALAALREERVL